MNRLRGAMENHPLIVTAIMLAAVCVHGLLVRFRNYPAPVEDLLTNAKDGAGVSIALGLASVSAIAAGFAGAIIVFGISADTEIMRKFRLRTAKALRSNWISVIGSSFASAVVSLVAAVFVAAEWFALAAPTLTFGLLLLIHGLVRMLWLFGVLLEIVQLQDDRTDRRARTRSATDIFRGAA